MRVTPSVALHEAYHGQESKAINEKAQALINSADSKGHTKATREVLQEARKKMEDAGEAGNERESAAYIIESAVQRGREVGFSAVDGKFMDWVDANIGKRIGNLIRDFVSMVRAHALRLGVPLKLSIDDLVAYAKLGIEQASQGTTVDGDGVMRSDSKHESAESISPGQEFWRKIKVDEPFTKQELANAYLRGRRGTGRAITRLDAPENPTSEEAAKATVEWAEQIAGFDGYSTFGVAPSQGNFVMEVVPTKLQKEAGAVRSNANAILSFMFRRMEAGK